MSFTPSRRSRAATLFEIADWLDPTSRLAALNEPDSIVRTKATSPVVLSRMVVMVSLSLTPIKDERVRGRLGELFLKARLGWRETDSNQNEGRKEERPIEDVRRRIYAKIARLANARVAGNSGEPTGT